MGIPKRTQNFRERAKQTAYDAQKEYEESYKSKDDRGTMIGSVFKKDILQEMGVEIWRPDVGEHVVDVIPFLAGNQHPAIAPGQRTYKVDFWAHQRIGSMNEFFVCNAKVWKKPDPICTFLDSQGYIEDKKEYQAIKVIKPSRRCAYLVWVHDNEEQEAKGIQIFEVAHFFFEKKVTEISRLPRGGGYVDWTCYDTGRHVYWTIGVTGTYETPDGRKGDSIEYTAFQLIPRDNPAIPDHILAQSFALDEVIKMNPTNKEMNLAFYGREDGPETLPTKKADRLTQKSILDRARETVQEDDVKELIENLVCEVCIQENEQTEIYETKSGRVCEKGHGGIEGVRLTHAVCDEPVKEKPQQQPTKLVQKSAETSKESASMTSSKTTEVLVSNASSDSLVCPASELGGVFGETIEQLDQCDDCDIWEECNAENIKRRSAGGGKLVSR